MSDNDPRSESNSAAFRLVRRIVDVRPGELAALLLSALYYFLVLMAYYVIRPIRDQMGIAGGVDNLAWMFSGTLVGTLIATSFFGALVAWLPRKRFIPITFRFLMLILGGFFVLLRILPESQNVWVGRVFFIWVSVFNLFVVSIFWSFITDIFRNEQGRRMFAFIALGGTLGAVSGSSVTAFFVERLGPVNLLLVSIAILEAAVWCTRALSRHVREDAPEHLKLTVVAHSEETIGGRFADGIKHVTKSAYLLNICLFFLLFTFGSTFIYIQQSRIIAATLSDAAAQTALFARIDLAVNLITVVLQAWLTAKLIRWLGVAWTLALLPALSVVGFLAVGVSPMLAVVVVFYVLRRAGNFAVARPTRELLYTVLPREDKYKAKNFIDTFVYRTGDQIGAWAERGLSALGLGVGGVALIAVPFSLAWLFNALWLGRRQDEKALDQALPGGPAAADATI